MGKVEVPAIGLFVFLTLVIASQTGKLEGHFDHTGTENTSTSYDEEHFNHTATNDNSTYNDEDVFFVAICRRGHFNDTATKDNSTSDDEGHFNHTATKDNSTSDDEGHFNNTATKDNSTSDDEGHFNHTATKDNSTSDDEGYFNHAATKDNSTSDDEGHFNHTATRDNSTSDDEGHFNHTATKDNSTSDDEVTMTCPASVSNAAYEGLVNIAFGKESFGSAVFREKYNSYKAVDCDNSTWYHSVSGLKHPWWSVDLGDKYLIYGIRILPGQHSVHHRRRFKDMKISIGFVNPIDRTLRDYTTVATYKGPYRQYEGWLEYRLYTPVKGRYVDIARTTLTDDDYVILAEVEVLVNAEHTSGERSCPVFSSDAYYEGLVNIAFRKKTLASPTYQDKNKPHQAVDCDTATWYHSAKGGLYPWWSVDLGAKHLIQAIRILPGPYTMYNIRSLRDIKISIGMETPTDRNLERYTTVATYNGPYNESQRWLEFNPPMEIRGRYVDISSTTFTDIDYIILAEVEVLSDPLDAPLPEICPIFSNDPTYEDLINIAAGKLTLGSATYQNRNKHHQAVDCDTSTWYHSVGEDYPWWSVDLGEIYLIQAIRILPGQHSHSHSQRFKDIKISIGMETPEDRSLEHYVTVAIYGGPYEQSQGWLEYNLLSRVQGRYVDIRRVTLTGEDYIVLSEVEVLVKRNTVSTSDITPHSENECVSPFSIVHEVGCLYLPVESSTWEAGQSVCHHLDSGLYVANSTEQFLALNRYYLDNNPGADSDIWVGLKNKVWLNGRVPKNQEWLSSIYRDVSGSCGYIEAWTSGARSPSYLLRDYHCDGNARPLCQKDV